MLIGLTALFLSGQTALHTSQKFYKATSKIAVKMSICIFFYENLYMNSQAL